MVKKSRKGQERKPRTAHLYATMTGSASRIEFTIDEATGRISFGQGMENVYLEQAYARPKGPKVVSRIPQAQSELAFDEDGALRDNFDRLFAIDTNTRTVRGKTMSVVGVVAIISETRPGPTGIEQDWRFELPFCLEYSGLRAPKPENFGWLAALMALRDEKRLTPGERIGLVVDSDLGHLPAYNARTLPVDSGHLLPSGVTLLYASADTGKENLINQALGYADSAAARILAALEAGVVAPATVASSHPKYDTYRFIATNIREGPIHDGIGVVQRR